MAEVVAEYASELARVGEIPANLRGLGGGRDAMAYGKQWAQQTAEKLHRSMGGGLERRVVVSGSIDIPQLVEPSIIPIARPVTADRPVQQPRPARRQRVRVLRPDRADEQRDRRA